MRVELAIIDFPILARLLHGGLMQQTEVIRPRQAAIEADAYEATVYWAISKGYLRVRRERGRVFILRDSFEAWRKRLEAKRKLREEEVEARARV